MNNDSIIGNMINEATGANEVRRDQDGNAINNPNANIPGMGLVGAGLTLGLMGAAVDAVDNLAAGATAAIQNILGPDTTSVFSAEPLLSPVAEAMGNTFDGQSFDANAQPFVAAGPVNEGPASPAAVARAQPLTAFTPGQPSNR